MSCQFYNGIINSTAIIHFYNIKQIVIESISLYVFGWV